MKKGTLILLLFIFSFLLVTSNCYPCTTFIFRFNNHLYFGRNLDWICGTGLIMTNPRNLEKVSLADSTENPARWTSQYGSITFNQVGRELPYGGINEAGLVVEHMTLDKTIYPVKDGRGALEPCQWIQYQLDNFSTIEEVIESDKYVRIIDSPSKFHFLVCDRYGNSAVIEFIDGKMVFYSGENLPYEALANSTYKESIENFYDNENILSNRSLYNFSTAAKMITQNDSSIVNPVDYAFTILNSVRQVPGTKWSIIYDITEMKFYMKVYETPIIMGEQKIFMKHPDDCKIKAVDVSQLDFNCRKNSKVLAIEFDDEGKINDKFVDYTTEQNREYISKAFNFFKGWGTDIKLTNEEIEYLAEYPEGFKCWLQIK